MTVTGFEKRIRAYCEDNLITRSRGQIQRAALKISKRMASSSTETDFENQLRILGIYPDKTARAAIEGDMELAW